LKYSVCTDEELFAFLKDGNHDAYAEIFERFYGILFVHALKMLRNQEEAKDMVQELFEMLWTKRENIFLTGSLSSYLYATLRNKILNLLAHEKVRRKYVNSLGQFMELEKYETDFYIRERELKRKIEHEIAALPSKMAEIFILSRKEFLSHKEIASKLKLSELTVKTQVKRAIKILRPKLGFIIGLISLLRL
jgi:RNA polymerase sigma-70 factor (ECF subfamily)